MKKYLALGDSYTIGEGVLPEENFPNQLVNRLNEKGIIFNATEIIATTGWTTDELIKAIDEKNPSHDFDLVTLLIGVNNQYRSYDIGVYKTGFEKLLKDAISYARGSNNNVFVLSIPDYGVTPFAAEKNPAKIASELDDYNAAAHEICEKYSVHFTDITKESRAAATDTSLIAVDGLHPSSKMYSQWVDALFPVVFNWLKK